MARTHDASPTIPTDENVGQPAPGQPSDPNTEYEGTPNFSTGAELATSFEEAQRLMTAGNNRDAAYDLPVENDPED